MERREFLKSAGGYCALLGSGLLSGAIASCASVQTYRAERTGNHISVPRSLLGEDRTTLVVTGDFEYDIAVHRQEPTRYIAVVLKCTHSAARLAMSGDRFSCALHGSTFDVNGKVRRGPAERPLETLTVEVRDAEILVALDE